jgi:hypothetical protein
MSVILAADLSITSSAFFLSIGDAGESQLYRRDLDRHCPISTGFPPVTTVLCRLSLHQ